MKLAPEAFALVSEAGFRTLGYRHHQVQYIGAAVMLDGGIAEIINGEGKTYTITLVAFVNSLYSDKTFVLDDSKYLTERNYKWMRGLYKLLGLEVGRLIPGRERLFDEETGTENVIYSDITTFAFNLLYR
jgi:preprotein translocase subunit SecA